MIKICVGPEMADERDEARRASCGARETSLALDSSRLVGITCRLTRLVSREFSEPTFIPWVNPYGVLQEFHRKPYGFSIESEFFRENKLRVMGPSLFRSGIPIPSEE
jgi:hypothetical protein